MSTLKGVDGKYPACSIDKCWEIMTLPDQISYVATHQILWFQLGDKVGYGCFKTALDYLYSALSSPWLYNE